MKTKSTKIAYYLILATIVMVLLKFFSVPIPYLIIFAPVLFVVVVLILGLFLGSIAFFIHKRKKRKMHAKILAEEKKIQEEWERLKKDMEEERKKAAIETMDKAAEILRDLEKRK